MKHQHFIYDPIKVTFKKKLNLRELTPTDHRYIIHDIILILGFSFALSVGIVTGAVIFLNWLLQ